MKIDNQRFNHKRIYFLICIILFSIFVISCGGVSLDDISGIDQTNKIGYFSKYDYMDGAPQWTIEYFEEFGKIFPISFYNRTGNQITPLKKNALVRKNGKIDVIASAKKQGFDIVVETRVSCVSSAKMEPLGTDVTAQNHASVTDIITQNPAFVTDVAVQNHASVVVTRVSDKKILWDSSAFRSFGPYTEEQCSYYICKMDLLKTMASTMAEGLVKSD